MHMTLNFIKLSLMLETENVSLIVIVLLDVVQIYDCY